MDSKNKKIDVKIAGYDTVFTLLNKSGEILSEGDNVFVESVKDNLTNGYVSERFGEAVWASGVSQDLSSYLQKTGDGKDVTVTYTESGSLSNISSGEKLSTMFGKIKKWFTDLKTVAFTGSYNDLKDKPEISASGTLNTNNSESLAVPSSPESLGSNIDLHKISKTGSYNDLKNKPTIPTKSSDLINDSFVRYDIGNQNLSNEQKVNARNNIGAGTSNFDGNYNSLTNKPNVPTKLSELENDNNTVQDSNYVHTDNNFTIDYKNKLGGIENGAEVNKIEAIKVNGTEQSILDKSVDINIPIKLSELENDNNTVQDPNYIHTDNNFSTDYKDKLDNIESNAEVNKIEAIKVNGTEQIIVDKSVDIDIPTKLSELENDNNYTSIVYLSEFSYNNLVKKDKNIIYVVKG